LNFENTECHAIEWSRKWSRYQKTLQLKRLGHHFRSPMAEKYIKKG